MSVAGPGGRQPENTSVRSSVTEEDLEEARQRLLDHIEVENEEPGECLEILELRWKMATLCLCVDPKTWWVFVWPV